MNTVVERKVEQRAWPTRWSSYRQHITCCSLFVKARHRQSNSVVATLRFLACSQPSAHSSIQFRAPRYSNICESTLEVLEAWSLQSLVAACHIPAPPRGVAGGGVAPTHRLYLWPIFPPPPSEFTPASSDITLPKPSCSFCLFLDDPGWWVSSVQGKRRVPTVSLCGKSITERQYVQRERPRDPDREHDG